MAVIIGIDPHKRSATIEVINERGATIETGKFGTDQLGYAEMLAAGRRFTERIWAEEGCNGVGRHIAHRLVHDGETVLDVPANLSAQVQVFATGNAARPTRSTRTQWPWSRCAPRTWSASRSTLSWS